MKQLNRDIQQASGQTREVWVRDTSLITVSMQIVFEMAIIEITKYEVANREKADERIQDSSMSGGLIQERSTERVEKEQVILRLRTQTRKII